ncbi:helix-turn-helix domain-containing protein [Nonomuraea sp. NPDC047529]|uniref:helix-turn-helix transcriptional regulator n=1 Tax=Nonomuraea sp. NPDC047529 TaxID=3155623 RepID=UPI0033C9B424
MGPEVFDSRDIGQTEEFLSKAYAKMRIGSDVKNPRTRISRQVMGSVSIDQLHLQYAMSYDVNPLGKVCLCSVESGTIAQQVAGGQEDVFGPGDTVLFAPHDLPYTGEIRRSRYDIIMFDPALLQQVAGTLPGRRAEPVRLVGHRPVSPAAARHLRRTLAYLRDDVLADPELTAEPLVVSTAGQLLAASVLTALPTNADASAAPGARPEALRRATAFIDDHADLPIGIDEIATAARVTPRALQYAFRRHLGTTPLGYLRQARLARAHAELKAGGPATTVTAVAARWGFFHPGRFAQLYRAAFGCAPGETLHAATGSPSPVSFRGRE